MVVGHHRGTMVVMAGIVHGMILGIALGTIPGTTLGIMAATATMAGRHLGAMAGMVPYIVLGATMVGIHLFIIIAATIVPLLTNASMPIAMWGARHPLAMASDVPVVEVTEAALAMRVAIIIARRHHRRTEDSVVHVAIVQASEVVPATLTVAPLVPTAPAPVAVAPLAVVAPVVAVVDAQVEAVVALADKRICETSVLFV